MNKKVYIVMVIVLAGGLFVFTKEREKRIKIDSLLFVNIESLAGGESGGTETKACGADYFGKMEYQNCNRNGSLVSSPMRQVNTYKCDGQGRGSCREGVEYLYYSCDGYIGSSDYTTEKYCF
ncbi:NVEALA domain-containing protein [Bacteroides timonensis]|uniref:NVEALA domain-containing protein n=1 Tax=Bacteroides timonensis TaxID=1470345 RepID=UPI0005C75FC3|nr:NVEALA domain-containing protein [Bacteroides timonensis]